MFTTVARHRLSRRTSFEFIRSSLLSRGGTRRNDCWSIPPRFYVSSSPVVNYGRGRKGDETFYRKGMDEFVEEEEDDDMDLDNFWSEDEDVEGGHSEFEDAALPDVDAVDEAKAASKAVRDELDARTGRLFSDPLELTDDFMADADLVSIDDLPDWNESAVGRLARELVGKDRVVPLSKLPLERLAVLADRLPLPPPPPPSLSRRAYNVHTRRNVRRTVEATAAALVDRRIEAILDIVNEEKQQDAIDALYEDAETVVAERHPILAVHPRCADWIENGVRQRLRQVQEGLLSDDHEDDDENEKGAVTETSPKEETAAPRRPIFMDLFTDPNKTAEEHIQQLFPVTGVHGNIKEEWELAAHDTTLRIMVRKCTTDISNILVQNDAAFQPTPYDEVEGVEDTITSTITTNPSKSIFVTGRRGVGKSTVLASIVASARQSGYVVLYLADGRRLSSRGKYIEPSPVRPGIYDLPVLSMEACSQLLQAHRTQLEGRTIGLEFAQNYLTTNQLNKELGWKSSEDNDSDDDDNDGDRKSLVSLLEKGSTTPSVASGIYASVMADLMNQTDLPFLVVLDDFNAYGVAERKGEYFHAHYDPSVRNSIPYNQISLFEPFLPPMEPMESSSKLSSTTTTTTTTTQQDNDNDNNAQDAQTDAAPSTTYALARPLRGAVLASISHSCSVSTSDIATLERRMAEDPNVAVVHVPQFSALEVHQVLANYECIGLGRLRFDKGTIVGDPQEVHFYRMVSGAIGKELLNNVHVL